TESKGRYGAPKIQEALKSKGKHASLKRVQRYSRRNGFKIQSKRVFYS
ncbi:IS3 family transposase, partial [Garciella nitratireducens]